MLRHRFWLWKLIAFKLGNIWRFISQLTGTDHCRRDQHLGWGRSASHLKRHQSCRQKDDGICHRRRDYRASQQTDEAGIGDTGEVHRPCGGQACTARASAAAQAGAASALAVRPAAGEPARKHTPARPAARETGHQPAERRPAGTDADGPAQG